MSIAKRSLSHLKFGHKSITELIKKVSFLILTFSEIPLAGFWNDWTFQHDGAPAHTSTNENSDKFEIPTQKWIDEHFPDFIRKDEWPAASHDLNPLDYSIWSILQNTVNAQTFTSVESLKRALVEAVNNLDQATINKAIDDWPRRLDAVINAKDGHFE
jgi:hypothetical protein